MLTADAARAAAAGTEGAALPCSDVLESGPEAGHWLPSVVLESPALASQSPASILEAPPPHRGSAPTLETLPPHP